MGYEDLKELSTFLGRARQADCEAQLTAIQIEVVRRLDSDPRASAAWFRELGDLLVSLDLQWAALQRVDTLIHLAWWFEDSRERPYALLLLERAYEIAEVAGAPSMKRRVLNSFGGIHNRARNAADATVSFVEALKLADSLGDRLGRCAAIANMASLRLTMGMIDDAIKLSQFVVHMCGTESLMASLRVQAHHCLAEAYLLLSDAATSRVHGELAVSRQPYPESQGDASRRVMMEATLVRALISLGEIEAAQQHTEAAIEFATKANAHTATIQAQLSIALCDSARGNTEASLARLAAIEPQLDPSDISFRDFMEVELFTNQRAGRRRYASYYNKKYLSSLSEFQRKNAIAQVSHLKEHLRRADGTLQYVRGHVRAKNSTPELFAERMEGLATLAELREDASGEHSYRVGIIAKKLALAVGKSEREAACIEHAARLHDIGKLATPDAILLKRGKLVLAELEVMRRHTTEGSLILADLLYMAEGAEMPGASHLLDVLRTAVEVAQYHHEWWDGSGYPGGVSKEQIPEAARIVALADVFDELTHARPYKREMCRADAIKQLTNSSGKQFDPYLCEIFLGLMNELGDVPARAESELAPFVAANRVIKRIATVSA